jgi:hypothetical protein
MVIPVHLALRSTWSDALGFAKRSVRKPKEKERRPTEVVIRRNGTVVKRLLIV